jgi:hypothetical protein
MLPSPGLSFPVAGGVVGTVVVSVIVDAAETVVVSVMGVVATVVALAAVGVVAAAAGSTVAGAAATDVALVAHGTNLMFNSSPKPPNQ